MEQTPPAEDVTSTRQDPRILGSNDGKNTDFGSFALRFMVWGEETGGKFSVVEHPIPPRTLAAPLHRHRNEDEYSYVPEGRMGAQPGDEVVYAENSVSVSSPTAHKRRGNMDTERESVVKEVTYVPPNEGKKLWVTDELITFKVTGEDTGGNYSLTDSMVPPQGGPPPHIHHREDEAFWVLEGELEILVGEDKFKASAGSFVHLPKGVLHSYQNIGTRPARFLTLIVPAGLEKFFEEVGKPATDLSSPPAFEQEDVDKLLAVAPRYGVQIPPPPES